MYPTKIFLSAKVRELTPQGEQKLEDFMLLNYMALLTELARELGEENIEKIDPNERPKEVRRLLENSYALIIIDNLETFDERERERLFQFLKRLPHSCKAIVTSRRRTDVAAEIIRLDRLSSEATQKLIAKLAERNKYLARATEQDRQELYEVTKGNPLLIEWLVGQLGRAASKCRTVAEACHYLEATPPENDPLEYIFGDLVDTFTEHETSILAALTHFVLPAKDEWIANVAGLTLPIAQTALEELADRSLLAGDVQTHAFVLPSLVTTFLRHKRPEIIIQTGNRLAKHVYALAFENGYDHHQYFPTLEAEWPVIDASLTLFLADDNVRLQRLCDALYTFMNFYGHWDERLSLSLLAEERAVASNDWQNAGWRANDAGRIYVRRGQASEALDCARRAEENWALIAVGARELATVRRLRGWGLEVQEDYYGAVSAYQEALDILRTLAAESSDVTKALTKIAGIQRRLGDYAAAERNYREALRIDTKLNNSEGIAICKGNLALLALDQNDFKIAEQWAREALPLSVDIGRQQLIASNCCRLAKALAGQGRPAEGLPHAQRAVEIFTGLRYKGLIDALAVLKECGG